MIFIKINNENISVYCKPDFVDNVDLNQLKINSSQMIISKNILDDKIDLNILPNKINQIKDKLKTINLGYTCNGTNTLLEENQKLINIRNIHPALVDYYSTNNGSLYRCHMSSFEKQYTINEYEYDQKILLILKENGYQELLDIDLINDIKLLIE